MATFPSLPQGSYPVILADPPWLYNVWKDKPSRTADAHYAVLPLTALLELPVSKVAADDAVLFLWVPSPVLLDGLLLLHGWGFSYRTIAFNWVKLTTNRRVTRMGLGHYTRPESEICLLGIRGHPKRTSDKAVRQVIHAPRRAHSQKPDEQYERIERLYAGPYLELFARHPAQRPNWVYWGKETEADEPTTTSA